MVIFFTLTASFIVANLVPILIGAGLSYILGTYFWKMLKENQEPNNFSLIFVLAGGLGWFSTFIFPGTLSRSPILQLLTLFTAPFITGFVYSKFKKLRAEQDGPVLTGEFWAAFTFVFVLLGVRYGIYFHSIPDLFLDY